MHVLLTGASGDIGRFVMRKLLADGCRVTALGRRPVDDPSVAFSGFDLADPVPNLPAADALVHCALLHEPGRFRGGEGSDPETFQSVNVDGSRRLFEAAGKAGCRQAVFLSSRAVYGDHRSGEILLETDEALPDSLYGEVKLAGERALQALCGGSFRGSVLRATGVYGVPPGKTGHKWSDLFETFRRGEAVPPRIGTEVHGDDLAGAVALMLRQDLKAGSPFGIFNVSDLLLDRHELLRLYSQTIGLDRALPVPVPVTVTGDGAPGVMAIDRLKTLGWSPGGPGRLQAFLRSQS